MKLIKKVTGLGAVALLAVGLAACGNDDGNNETSMKPILQNRSLNQSIIKLRESIRVRALWKQLKERLRNMN